MRAWSKRAHRGARLSWGRVTLGFHRCLKESEEVSAVVVKICSEVISECICKQVGMMITYLLHGWTPDGL